MTHDIHNYNRHLEYAIKRVMESTSIPSANKKAFLDFKEDSFAEGISTGRIVRYLWDLMRLSKWLNIEFQKAKKEDIKKLIGCLEKSDYADSTKRDLKITLRKFFKWLKGTEDIPEEVAWFKTQYRNNKKKLPEEVLTEEEVAKLIQATSSIRNRAFISTFYETGCRIGEILTLKLKHVVPANPGMQLIVNGKTGARRIRVIASAPYLSQWINVHPNADDPGAFLWIWPKGEVAGYRTITDLLAYLKKKTGIKKRIYPHIFRHSRATHLANHLTEAQMKQYFGWVQASKMASIYVHLSGRDVDNAILKLYGIKDDSQTKEDSVLQPRTCDRCKETNPPTSEYCRRCNMPLTKEAIMKLMEKDLITRKADKVLDELIEDPEFKQMFAEKIKALSEKKSG